MGKKIGIITFYYNNDNYGANLQAYALTKYLCKSGYDAEQICFDNSSYVCKETYKERVSRIIFKEDVFYKVKKKIIVKGKDLLYVNKKKDYLEKCRLRAEKTKHFSRELIPHSKIVYNFDNISNANSMYDIFITGSDQVWNLNMTRSVYFLDFVNDNKVKVSYAASMAMDEITDEQKKQLKEWLHGYHAISVREEKTKELLSNLVDIDPTVVVDPTLLLSAEDWNECSAGKVVENKYIFCYFLGENKVSRRLALEYAKRNGLKVVSIPMFNDGYHFFDDTYGDIVLNDSSPEEFISLIKYAECIFTDSFHCSVFSLIYKKQFYVFNRDAKNTMSSRIESLMKMFGCKNRFIYDITMADLDDLLEVEPIEYRGNNENVSFFIEYSKQFLASSLQ